MDEIGPYVCGVCRHKVRVQAERGAVMVRLLVERLEMAFAKIPLDKPQFETLVETLLPEVFCPPPINPHSRLKPKKQIPATPRDIEILSTRIANLLPAAHPQDILLEPAGKTRRRKKR
jgi:hypothetical protein